MKVATLVGLLRQDAVHWVDYVASVRPPSGVARLKWANRRARMSRCALRLSSVKSEGETALGLYSFCDQSESRDYWISSPNRFPLYYAGLRARGKSLAMSYGLDQVFLRPEDVVVDVGANYGDLHLFLNYFTTEQVRYVGIEPGVAEFECMQRNCRGNGVLLINRALGDFDGNANLYYSPEGADSSLERPPFKVEQTCVVQVARLDSLVQSGYLPDRIRFLKIEAEGTEPEVIQGAVATLGNTDYVAVDMGFERGLAQEATAPTVIPMLFDLGFRIVAVTDSGSLRFLFRREGGES